MGIAHSKRHGRIANVAQPSAIRNCRLRRQGNLNVSELARVCDISRTTAYKYIGLLEE